MQSISLTHCPRKSTAPPSALLQSLLQNGGTALLECFDPGTRDRLVFPPLLDHVRSHHTSAVIACLSEQRLHSLLERVLTPLCSEMGMPAPQLLDASEPPSPALPIRLMTLETFCRRISMRPEGLITSSTVVYLDDADALPDLIRFIGTRSLERDRLDVLAASLNGTPVATSLRKLTDEFFQTLARRLAARVGPCQPGPMPTLCLYPLLDTLEEACRECATVHPELMAEVGAIQELLRHIFDHGSSDFARFSMCRRGVPPILTEVPLYPGRLLAQHVFPRAHATLLAGPAIFCHRSSSFIRQELELPVGTLELSVKSRPPVAKPILLVPSDEPLFASAQWATGLPRIWDQLLRVSSGPTLGLVSSENNRELLLSSRAGRAAEVRLMVPLAGQAPVTIEPVVSNLLMERLPFLYVDDPVLDALRERGDAHFGTWSVPRAVLAFRGLVARWLACAERPQLLVVADSRLVGSSWGSLFCEGLGLPLECTFQAVASREPTPVKRTAARKRKPSDLSTKQ